MSTTARAPLAPLAGFLEEQIWALRDRADALQAVSLPKPLALKLGVVVDQLIDAALLLRRPTRTNRAGVALLIGQTRQALDSIERATWPASPVQ